MMLEAGLSFLGAGIQPPLPSWGQMINIGINFMFFYWSRKIKKKELEYSFSIKPIPFIF